MLCSEVENVYVKRTGRGMKGLCRLGERGVGDREWEMPGEKGENEEG